MMRAGDVVIVAIIVTFGTAVVGGNAIGENLTQFNYMPGMGVATATVILVANSLGRGDTAQMKRIIRESYWISTFLDGSGFREYLAFWPRIIRSLYR